MEAKENPTSLITRKYTALQRHSRALIQRGEERSSFSFIIPNLINHNLLLLLAVSQRFL